jgi:hypothetical protein
MDASAYGSEGVAIAKSLPVVAPVMSECVITLSKLLQRIGERPNGRQGVYHLECRPRSAPTRGGSIGALKG